MPLKQFSVMLSLKKEERFVKRNIKEYFNIYIYIIDPVFIITIYKFILNRFSPFIELTNRIQEFSPDIPLAFLGVLLTLLGLLTALPPSKYDKAMKKYNYYSILFSSLLYGIFATLGHLILFLLNILEVYQVYFFLIYISETMISTYWVYQITKLVFSDKVVQK